MLARIEELGGVIESVEFGDERTLDVVLRASRRSESAKVAEGVARARRRRAGAVAAVGTVARLCSRNAHKLEELRAALPGWELELLDADVPWPPEDGATYEENARGKALFGRHVGAGEEWMLGEDSGIEATALGGRPGDRVGAVGRRRRGAAARRARGRRRTGAPATSASSSASRRTGEELRGTGTLEGTIAHERRGDEGFGYDPIFVPDGETTHRRRARRRMEASALAPRPRRRRARLVAFGRALTSVVARDCP